MSAEYAYDQGVCEVNKLPLVILGACAVHTLAVAIQKIRWVYSLPIRALCRLAVGRCKRSREKVEESKTKSPHTSGDAAYANTHIPGADTIMMCQGFFNQMVVNHLTPLAYSEQHTVMTADECASSSPPPKCVCGASLHKFSTLSAKLHPALNESIHDIATMILKNRPQSDAQEDEDTSDDSDTSSSSDDDDL